MLEQHLEVLLDRFGDIDLLLQVLLELDRFLLLVENVNLVVLKLFVLLDNQLLLKVSRRIVPLRLLPALIASRRSLIHACGRSRDWSLAYFHFCLLRSKLDCFVPWRIGLVYWTTV